MRTACDCSSSRWCPADGVRLQLANLLGQRCRFSQQSQRGHHKQAIVIKLYPEMYFIVIAFVASWQSPWKSAKLKGLVSGGLLEITCLDYFAPTHMHILLMYGVSTWAGSCAHTRTALSLPAFREGVRTHTRNVGTVHTMCNSKSSHFAASTSSSYRSSCSRAATTSAPFAATAGPSTAAEPQACVGG